MSSITHIIEQHTQASNGDASHQKRMTVWREARIFILPFVTESTTEIVSLSPGADLTSYGQQLMVGVKKSDHRDFPLYRVAIGTILGDGHFVPGISPRADFDQLRLGTVAWDDCFENVGRLLKEAEEWVRADMSYAVDAYVMRGASRDRAPDKSQRGGKTERDRARGKAQPKR